jgi:hypothetical protein
MKATDVLKRIMTELSSVKSEAVEVKLEQMSLENGTVLEADAFEAGNEVFIVNEEERIALPVGEYPIGDDRILVVSEEGIIGEIKPMEQEEVEAEVEEVEASESEVKAEPKKVVETQTKETHFEEEVKESSEEVADEEVELAEESPIKEQVIEVVSPLIDEIKAELSAIREEMGSYKEKMSEVENENSDLKKELSSQSAAKPIKHNPQTTQKEEVKMANNRRRSSLDRVFSNFNK